MTQRELDFNPPPPQKPRGLTWEEKTDRWIQMNPLAWDYFKRYAMEVYRAGEKCGIDLIRGRVRWEVRITKREEFKINNNYSPWLARRLIQWKPELAGVFEIRETKENAA